MLEYESKEYGKILRQFLRHNYTLPNFINIDYVLRKLRVLQIGSSNTQENPLLLGSTAQNLN